MRTLYLLEGKPNPPSAAVAKARLSQLGHEIAKLDAKARELCGEPFRAATGNLGWLRAEEKAIREWIEAASPSEAKEVP